MKVICTLLGLNVFAIFLFKRDWLLKWKSFLCLFAVNCLLFLTTHLLPHSATGDPNFTAALKIPALQQLLFISLLLAYRAIFHRDPQDTWHSMDWKQMKDGVFNFIFWASSIIPVLLALDNVL